MKHRSRMMWGCLLLGSLAVLLTGCTRAGAVQAAQEQANADALVTMQGLRFVPPSVTIATGQSVEWNNTATETHTVTCVPSLARHSASVQLPKDAEPFNSGDLRPGQTYRRTFKVPGTYRYFCIPHESLGMVGEVVVEGGKAATAP